MWPIILFLAFLLFFLIPKDTEAEWDEEEELIDEMLFLMDDEEEDDW